MVFTSLVFLFLFLPVTLGLYYLVGEKLKNIVLLLASLFFYAWGEPVYILLMIISIIFNYIFGLNVSKPNKINNNIWLIISVIFNIGLLFVFKYTGFILYNFDKIFKLNINIPYIALPLGISFFTFQALSYVIDIYKKDTEPQTNILDLALYISLFPQLVAGPIVRYQTINEQINKRQHSIEKFGDGVNRFIIGLSKKVLISNPLGEMVDMIFAQPITSMSTLTAWIGVVAYALQLFFDFGGYSDMAIGLGKMFGFDFLENFNYPYISKSVSEFWRRWHISLGSWFRDYVYIPLGGSRKGLIRTYINLFVVWFLTGFWHGASWTFIMWGLYFGLLIAIEKAFLEKILSKLWKPISHIYLLFAVSLGWVLFRAESLSYAIKYIMVMLNINSSVLVDNASMAYLNDKGYLIIIGIILSTPLLKILSQKIKNKKIMENIFVYSIQGICITIILFIITVQLVNSTYNPFLYFRF